MGITTFTIILTVSLAVTVFMLGKSRFNNRNLITANRKLRRSLEDERESRNYACARYYVGWQWKGTKYYPAVIREVYVGETRYDTVIKVIDTQDAEYNLNEATEQVDKLNESICYQ